MISQRLIRLTGIQPLNGCLFFYLKALNRGEVLNESLSSSLNGLPRIDTIEKIAKALDVSIKSLFDDPVTIEGFVSVGGKVQRFNTREEFERIVDSRPTFTMTLRSSSDENDGLPF